MLHVIHPFMPVLLVSVVLATYGNRYWEINALVATARRHRLVALTK